MNSQYVDPDLRYAGQEGFTKQGITFFLFGGIGTMKTTWAGMAPKPLFLSIGTEGGDDSLAMLPQLYGIQQPPSYHITSPKNMNEKVIRICKDYKSMDINTVVIDSITYYVDMWITELNTIRYQQPAVQKRMESKGGQATNMTMQDWGLLAMHIRDLAVQLHRTQLNVIWIALQKEQRTSNEQTGDSIVTGIEPYIKGETNIKLPGMCKMVIHATKTLKPDPNVMGRMVAAPVFYTSPSALTPMVRHKYGNLFPEGCLVDEKYGTWPTWDCIYKRIGNFLYRT